MRLITRFSWMCAIVLAAGAFTPSAHAQYKTYPQAWANTPSPSYYDLHNDYDRETYMNPNPFPSYQPAYTWYRPSPYSYNGAYYSRGYSYGGPVVYGHYDRAGRRGFRYGWW